MEAESIGLGVKHEGHIYNESLPAKLQGSLNAFHHYLYCTELKRWNFFRITSSTECYIGNTIDGSLCTCFKDCRFKTLNRNITL